MLIANPIYDVVFKYLMEDAEIAKKFLSKIIGENIIEISFQPQEFAGRSDKFEIIILRLDFKAVIRTKYGEKKKILIELQKGKNPADILRFRRYLGDNYRKEDANDGKKISLPIITIYFLGFRLKNILTSVLKVNREYIDLIGNRTFDKKEEFIEKLTHDCFVIQIPRLKKKVRNELETILKVFNQEFITDDKKILEFSDKDLNNELLKKMAERLRKAATEEDVLRKIEIEEEVENTIEQHIREKQELKDILSEKDKLIEELKQKLKKKD